MYSDKQSAVDAPRSAHDLFQLISHPLRDIKSVSTNLTFLADRGAFRLFFWWLSSTAGYVPGNEAQLSSSDMASHKRVLSYGCYPFLSGRPGKPFDPPWQTFRPQRRASIATSNRSAVALSQNLTVPFADPFAGLKDRNLRDAESYTEKNFCGQTFEIFSVFYFSKIDLFFISAAEIAKFIQQIRKRLSKKTFSKNFQRDREITAFRMDAWILSAIDSLSYFWRGQKNPRNPSFRRRGTT